MKIINVNKNKSITDFKNIININLGKNKSIVIKNKFESVNLLTNYNKFYFDYGNLEQSRVFLNLNSCLKSIENYFSLNKAIEIKIY